MIGLYETYKTDAGTMTAIILDVLLRLNLSFEIITAQCYDGVSTMSGVRWCSKTDPWSPTESAVHSLQKPRTQETNEHRNQRTQDKASCSPKACVRCVRDILSLTNDLANFFRDSAKRAGVLESAVCSSTVSHDRLHPLSPTRWTVRARALNALVTHHAAVIAALDQLADEPGPTGAKSAGFVSMVSTFDCLSV